MTAPAWHKEAITRKHDCGAFDCGDAELNIFLMRYARQSHDQGGAKTFLAIDDKTRAVLGFYSVTPAFLAYHRAPDIVQRGLARHEVPGFRLARIAIDRAQQGQGLGGQLLLAAGRRCLAAAAVVGGTVLIINAKNDRAVAWYMNLSGLKAGVSKLPCPTFRAAVLCGGQGLGGTAMFLRRTTGSTAGDSRVRA